MSDEEKKAIEYLKNRLEILHNNTQWATENSIKIVLNLIEKQSKEIEELKKYEKYYEEMEEVNKKFIAVDKIKEILEIEEKIDNEKLLSLLQTIVDENARLEDIEDRKVQIEYNNVFSKGVKSVEDKIKAKIEEIENEDKKYKNYLKDGRENFTPEYVWVRPVLQSLLEKE